MIGILMEYAANLYDSVIGRAESGGLCIEENNFIGNVERFLDTLFCFVVAPRLKLFHITSPYSLNHDNVYKLL